jgi:putative NADH-flavin reductase
MTTLIVGANGATGKWVVNQLLSMGHHVKVIVRSSSIIPDYWENSTNLTVIRADISDMSVDEIANHIKDCQAVLSCLGHNMTMKGLFGKPKKLVTNTVQLICSAIQENSPESPVRFVLMNTAGNSNRDLGESISVAQKFVVGLIRLVLPPHSDNEDSADFLRSNIEENTSWMEWVVVRPDTLINDEQVTEYEVHPSPIRSAIFNPGKTSRINVGHFMARLVTENDLWNQWRGQMPVIYNKTA